MHEIICTFFFFFNYYIFFKFNIDVIYLYKYAVVQISLHLGSKVKIYDKSTFCFAYYKDNRIYVTCLNRTFLAVCKLLLHIYNITGSSS